MGCGPKQPGNRVVHKKRHGPPPVNTIRLIEVLENNACYKNIRKII
jgi:hypothetical protein